MRFFTFLFLLSNLPAVGQTIFGREPNRGQLPADVLFFQRGPDSTLSYTRTALRLSRGIAVHIEGANPLAPVAAIDPLPTNYNFFLGNNPAQWVANARQFRTVRWEKVYPGIDVSFTGLRQLFLPGVSIGLEQLSFTLASGADPAALRVRFENLGDAPVEGPAGIQFTGGKIPGVFMVRVEAVQDGAPLAATLKIATNTTLTVSAPALDPTRPAEIRIIFPNLQSTFGLGLSVAPKAADGNRYQLSQFPGLSPSFCSDVVAIRSDDEGLPLWVTLLGGAKCDEVNTFVPAAGGLAISGATASSDFPVPADAPGNRLLSERGIYFAWLHRDSGVLRSSTYSLFTDAGSANLLHAEPNGEVVAAGGLSKPVVPSGYSLSGFLLRWNPAQNRFVYILGLPDPVRAIAADGRGATYFATGTDEVTPTVLTVDARSETGGSLGVPARYVVSSDQGPTELLSVQLLVGSDFTVYAHLGWRHSPLSLSSIPQGTLARFSLRTGATVFAVPFGTGEFPTRFEFSSGGDVRLYFARPGTSLLSTTPNADLVAPCSNASYYGRLSPAGSVLYASFEPSTFDFDAPEPSTRQPSLSCAAATAGRSPLGPVSSGTVVRGQLVTLTGGNFGPPAAAYAGLGPDGMFPTSFAGYRVRMNGLDAPVIAVARGLIAVQVPFELEEGGIDVSLAGPDAPADPLMLRLVIGPMVTLFDTGDTANVLGLPALSALNQDGRVNSRANPAKLGSIVSVFGSGLDLPLAPRITGGLDPTGRAYTSPLFTTARNSTVLYLGTAPGLSTGVFQANLQLIESFDGVGVRPMRLALKVSDSPRGLIADSGQAIVWVKD